MTPLWRCPCRNPYAPGFPPPALSAPGFSQPFDGLLLRTRCLSCFIQTPPMGFKEPERFSETPRLDGLSEDMPNEDTKSGRASDESPTSTPPAIAMSLRLFDQLFTSERCIDVPLTRKPASEIPGRRTHQTARSLRARHMKCRFSLRQPVKYQRPKNTEDSRQADHHPLPSHPHQTASLTAKTIRFRKPAASVYCQVLVEFNPFAHNSFTQTRLS